MSESKKQKTISIIGAGSWGAALSVLLSSKHMVKMWSCFPDEVKMLNEKREHIDKLPNVSIPHSIMISEDLEYVVNKTDLVLLVVPSQFIRSTCNLVYKYIDLNTPIVCCSKGIEDDTGLRLSQVISQEIPGSKIAVLSGPSHAEEVGRGMPTAVAVASNDVELAEFIQQMLISPLFRVYTNSDVIGVEIGGAIKNVIALCSGISDGLGYGDNSKAALQTRGLVEMSRLGVSLGANLLTFSGLAGLGDLIVTCNSVHSRNRNAGILIGQGKSAEQAIKEVKMIVEGVYTTKAAYKLSRSKNVNMPITEEAYEVLFKNKDPKTAVNDLMTRDAKEEY